MGTCMKILRRNDIEIFLEHSAFLFLLNAAHANCFLLLMSYDFPRSRSSRLPRYLQFFQIWSDVLLLLYSSILSALTIRFLFVRILGTVFFILFISSLASKLIVIQDTSSA